MKNTDLQYEDLKVDAQLAVFLFEKVHELVVEVGADTHVCEHPVKLVGELIATRLLQ